jgi:hypothetical protein
MEPRFGHDFSRVRVDAIAPQMIQTKLIVGQSGDKYEQEADQIAEQVSRMQESQLTGNRTAYRRAHLGRPGLQRAAEPRRQPRVEDEEVDETTSDELLQAKEFPGHIPAITSATESRIQALRGTGQPLPESVRAFFEPRFGHDFSRVRVHTSTQANELAQTINSRAFTVGHDIVFGPRQYAPATATGSKLLAHELTHVLQQTNSPSMPASRINRATTGDPNGQTVLQTALQGDDDDVRNLTLDPAWPQIQLSAAQSVRLIIHLLDGPTLDEDEQAGLRILEKNVSSNVLDSTLEELQNRERFEHLIDDYHGSEYLALLDLLARHIDRPTVKAHFLDTFISMWRVNEDEEHAIVILLERTTLSDQVALLQANNRDSELRSAIDDDALSLRYERIIRGVNVQRGADLSASLRRIFDVEASASVAGRTRTREEVDHLLRRATSDLANELSEYAQRLNTALRAPNPDASAVAEINQEFEQRLDNLIAQKRAEFGMELRYNVEFNRSLRRGFGRNWTREDLVEMDHILSQIPPEILHANPAFRRFVRERHHEEFAGQASTSGRRITLAGRLTLGTTAHE